MIRRIRGIFYQVVVFVAARSRRLVDRRQHDRKPAALQHLLRLRLPERPRRLRHSARADRLLVRLDLSRALAGRLLNTLLVAVAGIITASIIGFLVGIGRLSRNWLIRKISTVYVEMFRNIPPLLVIFFWYLGVLSVLPLPRDSLHCRSAPI